MTTREEVATVEAELDVAIMEWAEAKREAQTAMDVAGAARRKRDQAHRLYLRHFSRLATLLYVPDADAKEY